MNAELLEDRYETGILFAWKLTLRLYPKLVAVHGKPRKTGFCAADIAGENGVTRHGLSLYHEGYEA
jgi:hypothetical protein